MINELGANAETNKSRNLDDYASDRILWKWEPYYVITDLLEIWKLRKEYVNNLWVQWIVKFDYDTYGDFLLIYPTEEFLKKHTIGWWYSDKIDVIKAEKNNKNFITVSRVWRNRDYNKITEIDFINPKTGQQIKQDYGFYRVMNELSSINNDLIVYKDPYGDFGLWHIVNWKLENKLAKWDKKIKKIKLLERMSVRSNIEIKTEDGCRYKIYSKDLYGTNIIDLYKIHKISSLKDKFANGISKIFGKKNK